jgi:2,3-bisphosphoglycerate-independent phosphoglycerate mutase
VPVLVLERGTELREGAGLSDIAPTLLGFLGLPLPAEMTGERLVKE